jgi:hypothetical protein
MSAVKLLLRWDINRATETGYYDYVVNSFIPALRRFGMDDLQFWYTTYGTCEQIQASAMIGSQELMVAVLAGDEWQRLEERLLNYVSNYQRKVIAAGDGFQL